MLIDSPQTAESLYRDAANAVEHRRRIFQAINVALAQSSSPLTAADVLSPSTLRRMHVLDSAWQRLLRAGQELDAGRAVLVRWRDDYLVVPRAVLPAGIGRFLEGDDDELGVWPVWLVATVVIAAIIGVAIVLWIGLEAWQAHEANERLALDMQHEGESWIRTIIERNPELGARMANAYRDAMRGLHPGDGLDLPAAAAVGAGGLAIGLLVALMLASRGSSSGRRRNPRRRVVPRRLARAA